ncbi:exopolygalacturonase-like [Mercurialis annua]|uniref:exopolygalacturonase-like n=1 Tax=Mercurialis annua TaxID=3986 RepID=UPI0021605ACE|nr:exopolygalacturonase-like [Mercurialis annua]
MEISRSFVVFVLLAIALLCAVEGLPRRLGSDNDGGSLETGNDNGGDSPVNANGGDTPVSANGGDSPVNNVGGDSPVNADGVESPVNADGGESPVNADGGATPATVNADGGNSPVNPDGGGSPATANAEGGDDPVTPNASGGDDPVTPNADGGDGPVTPNADGGDGPVTPNADGGDGPVTPNADGGDSPINVDGGDSPATVNANGGDSPATVNADGGDSPVNPNDGDSPAAANANGGDSPTTVNVDGGDNPINPNGGDSPATVNADGGDSPVTPNAEGGDSPVEINGVGGGGGGGIFDVTSYGAKGDGKKDNTMEFMKTWQAACKGVSTAPVFLVPKGAFLTGPVVFQGPCKSSQPIVVRVQGTVQATSDLSQYSEDAWILFERIDGLVLTGGGIFHGQGASVWKYNDCKSNKNCARLPTSIKLIQVKNAIIHDISSIDSKYFHFHVTDCSGITAYNLEITAPDLSPNTDGLHISDTSTVNISSSTIATGDDCISIGQGVTEATITGIMCGPGHGISVGSLGRRQNEAPVNGITVRNCTLSKTTNGARIKTFAGSPPGSATSIIYEDIIMDQVKNPIIIDQKYASRGSSKGSQVKVKDVHFMNIRGTTTTNPAVNLDCSPSVPCEGIEFVDIDLAFTGSNAKTVSSCSNAKVSFKGTQNPPACKQ